MLRLRVLLPCLLATTVVFAGDPASLAELLPPNTPAYLETQNPPLEELKRQAIWQCMQEPAVKKALERMFGDDAMAETIPLGSGALLMKSDFRDMSFVLRYMDRKGAHEIRMRDRFAFAWIGMAEGRIPVDAVAAIGVTNPVEAMAAVKRILGALSLSMRKRGVSVEAEMDRLFSPAVHREQEYTKLSFQGVDLYMATFGKLFFVATTEARMRESIDRWKDGGASLAKTERFKDIVKNARGTGSTTTVMAVQIDSTLDALEPMMQAPIAMVRGTLAQAGLAGLKTLSSVSRVEGVGISNTTSILLDRDPNSPLFKPGKPVQYRSLAFAPKGTFYVNCMGIDRGTLSALVANPMAAGMFQQMFGLRLKEDLLDLIGDEIGIIVSPNNGLIPDIAFVVHSTDAARLEESLVKMASSIQWPAGTAMHSPTIRDVKAHVIPLLHPQFGNIPLAPTFGAIDGKILIAPSPLAFQRFVAVAQGAKPNINENRDFAKLREMIPADAGGASYLNLPRLVGFLYDTAVPFIQSVPQPTNGTPVYELPEAEVFTKHLYGRVAWTRSDDRGWHWVSHAPIDMSGFMIAGAASAVAAIYFVANEADGRVTMPPPRGHDHEAMNCRANVSMLAARLRFYRRENKALPSKLDDIKAEYLPEDTFVVPGTDKAYVYLGPKGKGGVLLHGHPNGRDKRVCVITRRMKVIRVSADHLKRMLDAQSDRGSR